MAEKQCGNMLILDYKQILDKHTNKEAYVCAHGPSLKQYSDHIENKQKEGSIRISANDWWNFFSINPQYCCLANSELTIEKYINKNNVNDVNFFYADSVDSTNRKKIIDSKINVFGYDQRHFKNHNCTEIIKNYLDFDDKNNFLLYGNNKEMWLDGRATIEVGFAGFDRFGHCCSQKIKNRPTVQEYLQKISNTEKHYSSADTVILHAISFAIIMNCNPIYIVGMDLNYKLNYSNGTKSPYLEDEWNKFKINTINDLEILNQSAKNRGIKIINLTKNPWYGNIIEQGEL